MNQIKNKYTGKAICSGDAPLIELVTSNKANLCGANLCGATYDDNESLLKYFTVGPIGSRNDYLQVFITDKQTILKTGCFSGNIGEFTVRTNREDYLAVLPFIKQMVKISKITEEQKQ